MTSTAAGEEEEEEEEGTKCLRGDGSDMEAFRVIGGSEDVDVCACDCALSLGLLVLALAETEREVGRVTEPSKVKRWEEAMEEEADRRGEPGCNWDTGWYKEEEGGRVGDDSLCILNVAKAITDAGVSDSLVASVDKAGTSRGGKEEDRDEAELRADCIVEATIDTG